MSVGELFTQIQINWAALWYRLAAAFHGVFFKKVSRGAPRWDPWTASEVSSWKRTNC